MTTTMRPPQIRLYDDEVIIPVDVPPPPAKPSMREALTVAAPREVFIHLTGDGPVAHRCPFHAARVEACGWCVPRAAGGR